MIGFLKKNLPVDYIQEKNNAFSESHTCYQKVSFAGILKNKFQILMDEKYTTETEDNNEAKN